MSFMNRSVRRVWNFHPRSYKLRVARASFRDVILDGPKLTRLLLVSDGAGYTSEQQFAPIGRHAGVLRDQLGVVAQYQALAQALLMDSRKLASFDIVGLKLNFRTPVADVERIVQHFSQALAGTVAKLVYFDGDDDSGVQWHAVISAVDLYVKKHIYANPDHYVQQFIGKSTLTDYAARQHGVSFANDIIPTSGGISAEHLSKLHLGWNIGLDDKIFELSKTLSTREHPVRDLDISCRAYVAPEVWTHELRNSAIKQMAAMSTQFRVLAPRDRVPQDKYYEEMLRSKICVSPFGFGELCWRDFEAILCGCLLVKPDMGHLKTSPDLFIPHVTYVPVRWDYSDLEAQCARYLANEGERLRIVKRARDELLASLTPEFFLDRFSALLARLRSSPNLAGPQLPENLQFTTS